MSVTLPAPATVPTSESKPGSGGGQDAGSASSESAASARGWATAVSIVAPMLIGVAVRIFPFLGTNFPVGDGGMFYLMVRELLAHGFVLPRFTAYNGAHIPFTYPPLGFSLVAALHALTGADILELFRVVPFIADVLAIGAFALLARALLPSERSAAIAAVAFALLPQSFEWELQGGGITRSLGMLFALLALYQVTLLYRGDRRHLMPAIVLVALTVLSHPEWTWFTAYSLVLVLAVRGRSTRAVVSACLVAGGAAVVVSPWLISVISAHGTAPFQAALLGSGKVFPWYLGLLSLFALELTSGTWFPVCTALAILGAVVCLGNRRWLLPAWLVLVFLIDGRASLERAVVPLALLAGVGCEALLASGILARPTSNSARRWAAIGVAVAVLWTMCSTLAWESRSMASVSPPSRSAMRWVSSHTPRASTFLLITGTYWGLDFDAEWFPALAHRVSLTTVQGSEWVPGGFARQYRGDTEAQQCALEGASCVDRWIASAHKRASYVWIAKRQPLPLLADAVYPDTQCCRPLLSSLAHDPRYHLVYNGQSAAIFQRLG